MSLQMRLGEPSPKNELDCAREIVDILFERTMLVSLVQLTPIVIVGGGNWISFTVEQQVSMEEVLGLHESNGTRTFIRDALHRSERARSRTRPSLHLTSIGSDKNLAGHVDAFYYARNPFRHAYEFITKKTTSPSKLLSFIYSSGHQELDK